jgi:hypothetical protein
VRRRRSNNNWVWAGPIGLLSYGVYLKAGWVAVPVGVALVALVAVFLRREARRRQDT